jgi:hypothetical protein
MKAYTASYALTYSIILELLGGPSYIASAQTIQKTLLPTLFLLLSKCLLLRSCDSY